MAHYSQLDASLNHLAEAAIQEARDKQQRTQAFVGRSVEMLLAGVAAAIALALGATWTIGGAVARPLAERTAQLVRSNELLRGEIAERRQAEERVKFMAHHDALTGLANRLLFEDRVNRAIALASRAQEQVGVVFIDLDHFKDINDSLGHHAGDQLLKDVAQRLQSCLRAADSVGRLGGDEFVLALPGLKRHQDAMQIADKVIEALREPFRIGHNELHVSASLGIGLYPSDGHDAHSLLRAADTAMYHAKASGRSNAQYYFAHLNEAAQRRLAIANRLHQALQRDELAVHYQPQVDLQTGRVFSVEALLRWQAEEFRDVTPGEFVRIAEETGLIVPIGEWVLREACLQVQLWRVAGHRDMQVAVNLSPRQLRTPGFAGTVAAVLAETGLPAAALELEITEGMLMQQGGDNAHVLGELAALGVRLAVDDFGTGYSNLGYLRRFPITSLKIDQSFVRGLPAEANDAAIVTTIMAMALGLRLKVVAEGVETQEQADFLFQHGCLAAQGYLFGRPVPAGEIPGELLRRRGAAAGNVIPLGARLEGKLRQETACRDAGR
jgi:diguanylate cyclase (GGDEF)-like protein